MFALTTLVYPCLLAILCLGAGLLVDRLAGNLLPGVLLPAVGAAALLALSQLMTYRAATAPATPDVMIALAGAGLLVNWRRVRASAASLRPDDPRVWLPVTVYLIAIAPVLLAGRPSFSAYGALTDSAFHIMGADYLIRHGQEYAQLDPGQSYGRYILNYYGTGYPSGADTLFGGSAAILGLPLIWAFQPFNAFMVALAAGPIGLLARRTGLKGTLAALATLTATIPALVYGYELIASVKEITALPFVVAMGALVVTSERWLRGPVLAGLPFALCAAGGVSALGVGFAAWIGADGIVLAGIVSSNLALGRLRPLRITLLVMVGAVATAIAALPTVRGLSASLETAQTISTISNPGNLRTPLKLAQAVGTWLTGAYTTAPSGLASFLTYVAVAITLGAALVGVAYLLHRKEHPLVWWLILMVLLACALTDLTTRWVDAKTLMLSSPVIMLLAWAGVAGLIRRRSLIVLAVVVVCVLTAGVLASDALQYNATRLAPTARYGELASIEQRFAGHGPALFTDFDEYSLYVLRELDVGGPDFLFPPPALAYLASQHGYVVNLNLFPPKRLRPYRLIITRIDPAAVRPPADYRLLWQGTYYQVWGRRLHPPTELENLGLHPSRAAPCARVAQIADLAARDSGELVAAPAPLILSVPLERQRGYAGGQLELTPSATVRFRVPRRGRWEIWLRGELTPHVTVSINGRPVATLSDQLAGNDFNPDTLTPLTVTLRRGRNVLSFVATGSILAPGDGGEAEVSRFFLTPPGGAVPERLRVLPPSDWRSLCGAHLDWIEAVRNN